MPYYKKRNSKKTVYRVQVTSTDVPGHTKTIYATAHSLSEAKEKEKELQQKLAIAASSLTIKEGITRYLVDQRLRTKITTYKSTYAILTKQIEPYLGNYKIIDVAPRMIRDLQNEWLKKGYRPSYLSLLHAKLSALFVYFERFYALKSNPVKLAGTIGSRNAKEMNFWTYDEYIKFYKGLRSKDDIAYQVLYQILFYTGCRIGEAFALFPSDVDCKNRVIHITKTYVRLDGKDIIQPPKTRSSVRDVSIPHFLVAQLSEYIKHLPGTDCRLFFNLSKFSLFRKMRSNCQKTGVKLIRVHDIRHSAVAFLIAKGVPILEISKRCGHRTPDITYRVYAHLYPDKEQSIAELLDKIHSKT